MRLPALIILVLASACSSSPRSQLVGTWRRDEVTPDVLHLTSKAVPTNQVGEGSRFIVQFGPGVPMPPVDEEFREDGTCGIAFFLGNNTSLPGSWRIVDRDDTRVVIEQRLADRVDQRTFAFESSDVIREVGGLSDGVRMRRVDGLQKAQ